MELIFESISAGYHKRPVLEGVSFTAKAGCVHALIGLNGAGKSTLIQCLTGEKQDYQGTIRLDQEDVRSFSRGELACKLACLPQNLPIPCVTLKELVCFGRTPYTPLSGRLSETDRQAVDQAIEAVGLQGLTNAFVDTLSGGERKKAFFAMTLAQDTPVVVLDEPTAHLDTASRFAFLELIHRLCRETGKTFLVIMHDLPEVLRYADQITVLHDRRVFFTGTAEECLAQNIPQECFGIRINGNKQDGYSAIPL